MREKRQLVHLPFLLSVQRIQLVSEAKGIPLLVALLEIGSPEAKIQAAGAMQWLAGEHRQSKCGCSRARRHALIG